MEEDAVSPPELSPQSAPNRHENSLHLTTQRFMMLRQITKDKVLNLNDAADFLYVPKRRLYDITNVLEGIGIVQKIGKNSIKWLDHVPDYVRHEQLKEHVELLTSQEQTIDDMIHDLKSLYKLSTTDPVNNNYAYVKNIDIKKTSTDRKSILLKELNDSPSNLEIQVSDPQLTGNYEMIARHRMKQPIDVFLSMNSECAALEPSSSSSTATMVQNNNNNVEVKSEVLDEYTRKCAVSSTIDMKPGALNCGESASDFIRMEPPQSDLRPWNTLVSPPNLFDLFPQDEDWQANDA